MVDARTLLRPAGFATLLTALVLAEFGDVVLGENSFFHRDFHLFGYPLAAWFRQSLLAGEIPLWNPLNYCGIPFLAQWNTMVLYPPNWINLVLPLSWSLSLFCVLHLYVGGLGMYFLATRWTLNLAAGTLAGVLYAFHGLTQNCLMWPNNIAALGWLPWVILLCARAWQGGGGAIPMAVLVGTLQMFTGAPEIILLTWVFLAAAALTDLARHPGRRILITGRLLGIIGLIAGLSAAQLLPFLDLLFHSQRLSPDSPVEWSIALGDWAKLFAPLAGITERHPTGIFYHASQRWTHSYYPGLLPWLLLAPALAGTRRARVWMLAAVVGGSFLLALGPDGPLYGPLSQLLPLEVMRYPVKFITLTTVALPLLAACGIKRFLVSRDPGPSIIAVLLVTGALTAVAQTHLEAGSPFLGANLRGRGLVLLASIGILWFARRHRGAARQWCLSLLVITAWMDLKTAQPLLAPTVPRSQLDQTPPAWEQFKAARFGQGRLATTADALHACNLLGNTNVVAANQFTLFQNANLPAGLAKVDGFYSLWLPWSTKSLQRLHADSNALVPGLADFLGVTWTMAVDPATRRSFRWHPRPTALPLVTVGQSPVPVTADECLNRLGEFDPRTTVLLMPSTSLPESGVPEATVQTEHISPHRLSFTVVTPGPTVAVIAQSDHPAWQARVSGQPTKILRANHGFQAVIVPAGEHRVELRYVDRTFLTGVALSSITVVVLLILGWRCRKIRTAATSGPPPAG